MTVLDQLQRLALAADLMRDTQKLYFRTRTTENLTAARVAEKDFDRLLARINQSLYPKTPAVIEGQLAMPFDIPETKP